MKGILLAGGFGTRLYPLTVAVSKQLLPIYDKPMVYYPLTMLMLAGIREILVISTPTDTPALENLLGDGSGWGLELSYSVQDHPRGIADAFRVGADFVFDSSVCLVLGDNLFFGRGLLGLLQRCAGLTSGATILASPVSDPTRFGVVEFDARRRVLSVEEKPARPRSNHAAVGIYFYDRTVLERFGRQKPSARGELEITDLNRSYLDDGALQCEVLGRGVAWLDAGTPEALVEASRFVETVQARQGLLISSPEEIALRQGFINREQYLSLISAMPNCRYREVLERSLRELEEHPQQ